MPSIPVDQSALIGVSHNQGLTPAQDGIPAGTNLPVGAPLPSPIPANAQPLPAAGVEGMHQTQG